MQFNKLTALEPIILTDICTSPTPCKNKYHSHVFSDLRIGELQHLPKEYPLSLFL